MCEQRRQEALSAAAAARGRGGARGVAALDALGARLARLTRAVHLAYRLPSDALEPTVYHNDLYRYSPLLYSDISNSYTDRSRLIMPDGCNGR